VVPTSISISEGMRSRSMVRTRASSRSPYASSGGSVTVRVSSGASPSTAFSKPGNHLAGAHDELERLAALRAVEDRPVLERAGVVDPYRISLLRL
jgi:hypothetical protein